VASRAWRLQWWVKGCMRDEQRQTETGLRRSRMSTENWGVSAVGGWHSHRSWRLCFIVIFGVRGERRKKHADVISQHPRQKADPHPRKTSAVHTDQLLRFLVSSSFQSRALAVECARLSKRRPGACHPISGRATGRPPAALRVYSRPPTAVALFCAGQNGFTAVLQRQANSFNFGGWR
jgi:hypothetical protein